ARRCVGREDRRQHRQAGRGLRTNMSRKLVATAVAVLVSPMLAWSALAADASLAIALKHNDRDTALELLEQKADVNAAEADGTTPLHWAVYQNDVDLVDRLIKAGANVNAMNEYGSAPLAEAATTGDTAIIEKLL